MPRPKAYDPQPGYKYQIVTRSCGTRAWEHCDYARNRKDLGYLINEYALAYGIGFEFASILLPAKFWPKES